MNYWGRESNFRFSNAISMIVANKIAHVWLKIAFYQPDMLQIDYVKLLVPYELYLNDLFIIFRQYVVIDMK